MEIKTYADITKMRDHLLLEIEKRDAEMQKRLAKSPQVLVESLRESLDTTLEVLKRAERARESLLKRADSEIARHVDKAKRLENEIAELESSGKGASTKTTPSRPAKPK